MLTSFPITGKVYASDSSTNFPDVTVRVTNTTKNVYQEDTTETDGSFAFDLANFIGGYSNGDSLKIEARLGSFYNYTTSTVNIGLPGLDFSLTLATESTIGIMDFSRIQEELTLFFREKLPDPSNRGSIETNTQTGTGSKVKFELPISSINCVYTVLVNDTVQTKFTDYYVNYKDRNALSNPIVYFLTPPSNGARVDFVHHYDTTWIYPDVPRVDLSLDSYPRANIRILSVRTNEGGLGSTSNITDILGSVTIWSIKENQLTEIIKNVRELIMQNKKDFHYFKLIVPQSTGPIIVSSGREERIVQQSQDFEIKFRLEVI